MLPTRVLLADDEPLIRAGVRQALSRLPGIVLAHECENGAQALAALRTGDIGLALLDIHMPDHSGIEIVRSLGPSRMPPTVFLTAYDHYAIQAFELNAVDYVLKPFDDERLLESVHRARRRIAAAAAEALSACLAQLVPQPARPYARRLTVKTAKGFELIPTETIDRFEAADNYVQIHSSGRTALLAGSMNDLQTRLDPAIFVRIHRRHIVNLTRIKTIAPLLNGTYEVLLHNGHRLPTGRQYRPAIQQILSGSSGSF